MPAHSGYIALGEETSYGVAVSPSKLFDITAEGVEHRKDFVERRPARVHGVIEQRVSRHFVVGTFDALVGFDRLAYLLRYLLGAPSSSASGAGYAHVFEPRPQELVPSLTLDIPREQERHRYSGIVFREGGFSIDTTTRHFAFKVGFVGKQEEAPGSISSVSETSFETPINPGDSAHATPFQLLLSQGSTNYVAEADQLNVQALVNRALRQPPRFPTPTGVTPGTLFKFRCGVRLLYDANTQFLLDAFRNVSDVSASLIMRGALIGGSTYEMLEWNFPLCRVAGKPPMMRGTEGTSIEFQLDLNPLLAFQEGEEASTITVTNATASY